MSKANKLEILNECKNVGHKLAAKISNDHFWDLCNKNKVSFATMFGDISYQLKDGKFDETVHLRVLAHDKKEDTFNVVALTELGEMLLLLDECQPFEIYPLPAYLAA